ncbi:hypothetical protein HMPREF0972_01731 [Actinomyces sp. oral taxon 848 str. F0332]|nr:hypothetical protein HMPREF0972_01731 [Actinomyces sp. oral taxon 848 str. F0332]
MFLQFFSLQKRNGNPLYITGLTECTFVTFATFRPKLTPCEV